MDRGRPQAAVHQRGVVTSGQTVVNAGDEDEMKITGFRKEHMKEVLSWILTVATFGFLQLLFYWRPHWRLKLTCAVTHLDQAEYVLLEDQYGQKFVEGVDYLPSDDNFLVSHKQSQKPEVVLHVQNSDQHVEHLDEDLDLALLHTKKSRKYFTNKLVKYFWNSQLQHFEKLCGLEEGVFCSFFHESKGLTEVQQLERRRIYGSNNISVHVTPVIKLLYTQVLNPFYIFQLFSCILWFSDTYFYYATCIVLVSCISIAVQIYQTRSMQRAVKSTIAPVELVNVYRSDTGAFETVHSDALVPGDIIEVPRRGCMMQCDAVLVNGNCIVNESMLTGESVPVTKTPISNHSLLSSDLSHAESAETLVDIKFQMKEHSRHVLFCGTHVIQTRYYGNQPVKAVVIRTGFSTAKGELVRSILFPKPVDFKFSEDGIKFVGFLSVMAVMGMLYTLVLMVIRGENAWLIVRRTLDLITIIVPPALPAAMTIGIVFAQKRLSQRNIFCISPRSINLCGALNVFCFDKTGTLTEDGLDMWGVVTVRENKFINEKMRVQDLDIHHPVVVCMATCHSLTIVEGQITGDPLDLKMFEATDWMFEEPGEDSTKFDVIAPNVVHPKKPDIVNVSAAYDSSETLPYEIGILRQFTFSSKLQRMSVISRELSATHFDLYAKGSPEMIASLCKPDTVPSNFHDVLMLYTEQGYRVIGLAHRKLPNMSYVKVQRALRDQMESELTFLGLLILENRLKIETMPIIRSLKEANIRTLMITGDNMLTALSVARDCRMIECNDRVINITVLSPGEYERPRIEYMAMNSKDKIDSNVLAVDIDTNDRIHFAITGKSWALLRRYFPEILPKLVVRGTVFARFSPEQKQQLIESLQSVGYYVGMCGDGANDCGALKTAHAGISLSEAEASVASPFTSKEPNICCVPILIMEGRAALVTSFGIFKFMAGYSMTQFLSVCLVYWIGANLTDGTFLYIDLPLLTTLGITFCYTRAYPILHHMPPKISLVALTPILSILLTLAVNMVAQVVVFIWIRQQPWFEEYSPTHEADYWCYEVTAVFSISAFQYITMAVVFSKGSPYRQHMFTNYLFLLNLFLCTAVTMVIVVYPPEFVADLLNLRVAPSAVFRGLIVGLASINFLLSLLIETIVIDGLVDGRLMQRWHDTVASKRLDYVRIEDEIKRLGNWPPISHVGLSLIDAMRLEHSSPGYYDDHQISNGKIPRQDSFSPEHSKNSNNLSDNSPSSATTSLWPPSSTGLDSLTVEIHDINVSYEKMSHDADVSVV